MLTVMPCGGRVSAATAETANFAAVNVIACCDGHPHYQTVRKMWSFSRPTTGGPPPVVKRSRRKKDEGVIEYFWFRQSYVQRASHATDAVRVLSVTASGNPSSNRGPVRGKI